MSKKEPPGEVPAVSVSGSQGIQVGGNQYNTWGPKPQLDPTALGALNPHTAVSWLQELEHRELVNFFARAQPDEVSEILEVFFRADLSRLATALADINRRKAIELIRAIGNEDFVAILADLPEASEEIAREAARLRWADAGPVDIHTDGSNERYARKYKNGRVFWSKRFAAWTTTGEIDDCIEDDEEHNPWGFPLGHQETAPISPYGTEGIRQNFESGTVYSSKHGVFFVEWCTCHEDEGGSSSWLGFPVGEWEQNGPFEKVQRFEGGNIFSGPVATKSPYPIAVPSSVLDVLPDYLEWCRPLSLETATESSCGNRGTVQEFELAVLIPIDETGRDVFFSNIAVYSSGLHGTFFVEGKVWEYYRGLGAERSRLGFPLEAGGSTFTPRGEQFFEEGLIFWQPDKGPISVLGASLEFVTRGSGRYEPLGYPLADEAPVGADGSGSIQYFEKGVVTLRDGKREAWLRPEPEVELIAALEAGLRAVLDGERIAARDPGLGVALEGAMAGDPRLESSVRSLAEMLRHIRAERKPPES
jgi:REP element-mobilizing transposase RayT